MSNKLFTAVVITILACVVALTSLLGIAFVRIVLTPEAIATQATEPTVVCDDVKAYEDNTAVCEVFVRPSSIDKVKDTNSVEQGDRI